MKIKEALENFVPLNHQQRKVKPVIVAEIERLRAIIAKLPPDASEVPCCRCGGPVIEFSINNRSWNTIIRDDGPETNQEYLCFQCFAEIAAHTIRHARQE